MLRNVVHVLHIVIYYTYTRCPIYKYNYSLFQKCFNAICFEGTAIQYSQFINNCKWMHKEDTKVKYYFLNEIMSMQRYKSLYKRL